MFFNVIMEFIKEKLKMDRYMDTGHMYGIKGLTRGSGMKIQCMVKGNLCGEVDLLMKELMYKV